MFSVHTCVSTCILLEILKCREMSRYLVFLKSLGNYMYVFSDAKNWFVGSLRHVEVIFNTFEFWTALSNLWQEIRIQVNLDFTELFWASEKIQKY